jgi:uncharacterized membrane protein YeaQ/YmgE (transglycosylase-associated protein family)
MDDNTRALLVFALVGIVAGFLASIVVGGGGVVQYLISGVIGAFVGGYLLRALGVNLGISNPLVSQIVTSTIGAILVVLLAKMIV